MNILAIDPGTHRSAFVDLRNGELYAHGILPNTEMLDLLHHEPSWTDPAELLVVERMASYGKRVGIEVLDTCIWVGRFIERWQREHALVFRREVKLHLCGASTATDADIRAVLIQRYGGEAAIKKGGALRGVKGDVWQALALAVVFKETHGDGALAEIGGR